MRLIQFLRTDGRKAVAMVVDEQVQEVVNFNTVYDLANHAIASNKPMVGVVTDNLSTKYVDYQEIIDSNRILSPVCHPDPVRFWITGTGLTHAGSAATRDAMHKALEKEDLSDSMKMFKLGLENGKPSIGEIGVQPEWFYKGNGTTVVQPGASLDFPAYALDGGEEPEIACIYIIAPDGVPYRIGCAMGNEYSDHVMERINYLYLSHSKLRQCSFGPELLIGDLPTDISGEVAIKRNHNTIWAKKFNSGEDHMIHNLHNLEQHHFKYDLFRGPGDLHCHFLGTATFSFSDGIKIEDGDELRVESAQFGKPLINFVKKSPEKIIEVKKL